MRWGTIFFPLLLLVGCSQTSPEKPTQTLAQDSIQIWANTAKDSWDMDLEKRQILIERAYNENAKIKDRTQKVKNLSRISLAYSNLGDSLNFRGTNRELMTLAQEIGDNIAHGEAHWDLGDFFRGTLPDSAFYHYKEAQTLFSNSNLEKKVDYPGRMLQAMAVVRERSKDYGGAEKEAIGAIEFFKEKNSLNRLYSGYTTLAEIQNGLNKFDKALEYHHKAKDYIEYLPEGRKIEKQLTNQNNIAAVFLRKGKYKEAFEIFNTLEESSLIEGDLRTMMTVGYTSKAITGYKSEQLDAEEAMALIKISDKALDSMGNTYQKARNRQNMAEILYAEGQTEKAIATALEAKDLAERTGNNDRLLNVLEFLSQVDVAHGAEHSKAYFELNDQLQMQERSIQDKFARIQMETDEIIEENESLAKRAQWLAGITLGLLILGVGIVIIISQRISNQRLKFEQKQQESNQEIYSLMLAQHGKMEEGKKTEQKRVSEELHDGILGQMLGIRLILSGLNERNDPSAIEQRAELIVKLQELEEEIRTISHELNAAAYEKTHNFILSVEDLVATVEKSSKLTIDFEYDRHFEWDSLHNDIKINSYRITQELLQNCVKHAHSKNVTVTFQKGKNLLNLTVSDDGIGFDDSKAKKGIGLKNIISRVKKMGAQLEIKSQPQQGTKVNIVIPNLDLKRQHPKPENKRKTVVEV